MTINRRALLGSLIAAPAILSAPALASITPIPDLPGKKGPFPAHPFLGYQVDLERAHVMVLKEHTIPAIDPSTVGPFDLARYYANHAAQAQRLFEIGFVKQAPLRPVFDTHWKAEEYLLSRLVLRHRRVDDTPSPNFVGQPEAETLCHIVRQANRIASHTRRGMGNVVMLHEDDLHHLPSEMFKFQSNEDVRGRWRRHGEIDRFTVWTTRHRLLSMPRGFALVAYKGNETEAAGYILRQGDAYRAVERPAPATSWGDNADFLGLVGLTREHRLGWMDRYPDLVTS